MAGIVCLIRRICLLREQGEAGRAERLLERELAEALRAMREADGPDALAASSVAELFAREEERIAEAQVLAELLAPRLGAGRPVVSPRPAVASAVPASASSPPASPAPAHSIPDLLDAMLAAERTGPRTRR